MVEVFNKAPYNEKWTTPRALRKMEVDTKSNLRNCLGAFKDGILVGFMTIQFFPWDITDPLFITTLAVAPNHQGREIGSQLMQELFRRAQSKDVDTINLNANTKSQAFSFYEKHGFKASDWVNMVKKIG